MSDQIIKFVLSSSWSLFLGLTCITMGAGEGVDDCFVVVVVVAVILVVWNCLQLFDSLQLS